MELRISGVQDTQQAEAGRGSFSYIADRDAKLGLEKVLSSHLLDAMVPMIRDVHVDWGSWAPDHTVVLDNSDMRLENRLLGVALIGSSQCAQDLKLKRPNVRVTIRGLERQVQMLDSTRHDPGTTSTALHAAAIALYVEKYDNDQSLPDPTAEIAQLHRVATSATRWVFALPPSKPESKQAVLCEGLLSGDKSSTSQPSGSYSRTQEPRKAAEQGSLGSPGSPALSTRERRDARPPPKRFAEKLSILNFGSLGSSLSLRDETFSRNMKVAESRESSKKAPETDDWFRPRSSTFSVRGFARAGSALSIVSGSAAKTSGARVAPATWQDDPLSREAWPLFDASDDDFFPRGLSDLDFPYRTPRTPPSEAWKGNSHASELSTRNTPSKRKEKAAALSSRLSALDFKKLGQSLAFHGGRPHSRESRMESLSLFDASASSSRAHPFASLKGQGQSGQYSLSLRSQISLSKHAAATSGKLASSWAKVSATGVFALASQLSIRLEKSFGKTRRGGPASGSLSDLPGMNTRTSAERPGGHSTDGTSRPAHAEAPAPKEVARLRGWISLGVAGGILQGVSPVSYLGQGCSDLSDRAIIRWRPGRNASQKPAQVYLTALPLTVGLGQGILLGEVKVPVLREQTGGEPFELSIHLRIAGAHCELNIHTAAASSKQLGDKLMTAKLTGASPDKLSLGATEQEQVMQMTEALAQRRKAVREGFPTIIQHLPAKGDVGHTSQGPMWDPATSDLRASCHALLTAQRFAGCFVLDRSVLAATALSWGHLEMLVSIWKPDAAVGMEVAHTAFAVSVLKEFFQDMQASWYLVARRAEAWLQRHITGLSLPGCRTAAGCLETAGIFAVREHEGGKQD